MKTVTTSTLLEQYNVDQAHARHVADLSLALFDAVVERYRLPIKQRRLLEIGALLHNVGLTTDPPAHHIVGRDLVLRHQFDDLSPREQQMVASMVAFHRKRVRPNLEPAYLALSERAQHETLQLAAILRVADGLDYHHSQATNLVAVEPASQALTLILRGPYAQADGERAVAKADLWHKLFGETLHVLCGRTADATSLPAPPSDQEEQEQEQPIGDEQAQAILTPWYAEATTPLAELGRVLLRRHLRRLRMAERDVRADKEIEAIHALRVATRRLRSTLRLLAPVYAGGDLRRLTRGVGRIGRAAGAVRDRDVLLADLEARAHALPTALGESLATLRSRLMAERQAAHGALLVFLDSKAYAKFIRNFAKQMNNLAKWDNQPRVRDLGGSTIWQHYEALRAYDRDGLPGEIELLHMMRIEGKRMRYVLELFTDVLADHASAAIDPLVQLQDQLGILNDIAVASELLAPHARAASTGPAVAAYLALRDEQSSQVLEALPACWDHVADAHYRRALAELLVRL
ncbi:CHAD domain-containing protein [Candidatus Viridilinea mediisalina]|uniref:CHAD domain-containing protein n=1 Tax=Candidatus Viridilinea mediisalina TaxID=2024553 RepID=A0A2A6RJN8_9CHLR|nr:CHAD domain-containing protein [Candidatus Viridilinea mediisalina]PDW03105.1 hypothetical protein CJ255_10680 [Candidatus Viridilinea mediisalina]